MARQETVRGVGPNEGPSNKSGKRENGSERRSNSYRRTRPAGR